MNVNPRGRVEARTGPDPEEMEELRSSDDSGHPGVYKNQCLFVRTLNATVREDIWQELGFEFETAMDIRSDSHANSINPFPTRGSSSISSNAPATLYFTCTGGAGSTINIADFNSALVSPFFSI